MTEEKTRRRRVIVTLAILATGGAAFDAGAQEPFVEAFVSQTAALWPDHSACTFVGARREIFSPSARLRADERRAALTAAAAQLLAPSQPPLRSRAAQSRRAAGAPFSGDSIDAFIFQKLEAESIAAAPPTTDAEFLRRVTLDLTGAIPTFEETLAFLQDGSPDKRVAAVDRLLASPRWADRWTLFFGDLLGNTQRTAQVNRYPDGRDAFHLFLLEALRRNQPYDELAREILVAEGANDGRTYPPLTDRNASPWASTSEYRAWLEEYPIQPTAASYIVGGRMTGGPAHDSYDLMAVNVARDFLGIAHMDCVLCHDGAGRLEALNLWGAQARRSEMWGLSAFFRKVLLRRPRTRLPPTPNNSAGRRAPYWDVRKLRQDEVIRTRRGETLAGAYTLDTESGNRPARSPADYGGAEEVEPRYPFGGGVPQGDETALQALGRLLTADRQFARAAVNYLWREFFGRGIVEPANQFDLARLDPAAPPPEPWTLQPTHPELLEYLADRFIAGGFNLKALMREIVLSETYQLSSRYEGAWSARYEPYFARHAARRISAEALHDAVVYATGAPEPYPVSRNLPPTPFAIQFPDVTAMPQPARRRPATIAVNAFLDAFFRGDREESERSAETSILQALQLMNNPLVVERVRRSAEDGALAQILAAAANDEQLVGALYLQVLSRPATLEESAAAVAYLQGGDREERAEDLMWALLNKIDFVFNY